MSIKVTSLVWERSPRKGSELLLLLALADHSDDMGICYPSLATLAAKTRLSERNVRYLLRVLEDAGEITTEVGGGPKGCNRYQILPPAKIAPGGQPSVGRGGNPASIGGAIAIAPEPSIEPSVEPSRARGLQASLSSEEEKDLAVGRLCRAWENATGTTVTAMLGDRLADWLERLPEAAIVKAIAATGENGARAWKYTDAILTRYASEGWQDPEPKKAATAQPEAPLTASELDELFARRQQRSKPGD